MSVNFLPEIARLLDLRRHPFWDYIHATGAPITVRGVPQKFEMVVEDLNNPRDPHPWFNNMRQFILYTTDGTGDLRTERLKGSTFRIAYSFQILGDYWAIGPQIFQLITTSNPNQELLLRMLQAFDSADPGTLLSSLAAAADIPRRPGISPQGVLSPAARAAAEAHGKLDLAGLLLKEILLVRPRSPGEAAYFAYLQQSATRLLGNPKLDINQVAARAVKRPIEPLAGKSTLQADANMTLDWLKQLAALGVDDN